jgi:hypothetical protein
MQCPPARRLYRSSIADELRKAKPSEGCGGKDFPNAGAVEPKWGVPGRPLENMPASRRFPPPWPIEELNDACFLVSDNNGQKFAYVYF